MSKLPESREAFEEQLAEFYSKHGAVLSAPSIMQIPLDLHTIFKGVAERGGYEGVSGTRYGTTAAPGQCCIEYHRFGCPIVKKRL